VGSYGPIGRAVNHQFLPVDEVASDIADEQVAAILLRISRAAIDGGPGRGREEPGRDQLRRGQSLRELGVGGALAGPAHAPGPGRTEPEHGRRGPFGGDIEDYRRGDQGPVPLEVPRRQDDLPGVVAIIAGEAVPPVVERVTELPAAGDRLERRAIR